jgi:anaerobic magnesium-protoporphyrin IX monomethyl ester cyclase
VPNLVRVCKDRLIKPSSCQHEDMRRLPVPDFRGLPLSLYLTPRPVLPLLTSRGCYWHRCSFCTSYLSYGSQYSARPRRRLLEDIDTLVSRHGTSHFFFADQAVPPATLRWLADALTRSERKITFYGQTRCDGDFTAGWLPQLRAAGCTKLYFGVESGSPRMVRKMAKGIDLDLARDVLQSCAEAGIAVHLFFLVGFPGETPEDRARTIEFLESMPEVVGFPGFSMNFAPFGLEPMSTVGCHPDRFGIDHVRIPEGSDLSTHCLYVCRDGPAQDDLARLVREEEQQATTLIRHPSYPTAGAHCSLYLSRTPASLAAPASRRAPFPAFTASLALRPRVAGGAGVARDEHGRPVLYWPETATTRLLSADSARLLELCTGVASLEEICSAWVVEGRGKALQAWLVAKELWDAGLLTTQ